MNKRSLAVLLACAAIPCLVVAQTVAKDKQRAKNARLMTKTVEAMHGLVVGTAFYSQQNKGKLPPMQNPQVLRAALSPFTSKSSFVSPASGKPFQPNAKMSGKSLKSASNNIVLFYDVKPLSGPNNPKELFRVVGFANHVITMPEARWQREKAASGIR